MQKLRDCLGRSQPVVGCSLPSYALIFTCPRTGEAWLSAQHSCSNVKTVNRYLRDAGGPTRNADKDKIFVVLANGAVVSKDAAPTFWSGGFASMVLMPGDTVIVPEQLNPGAALRNFKDWSQILFNFGLAAAAINVLR